jgi:hypothetical protein
MGSAAVANANGLRRAAICLGLLGKEELRRQLERLDLSDACRGVAGDRFIIRDCPPPQVAATVRASWSVPSCAGDCTNRLTEAPRASSPAAAGVNRLSPSTRPRRLQSNPCSSRQMSMPRRHLSFGRGGPTGRSADRAGDRSSRRHVLPRLARRVARRWRPPRPLSGRRAFPMAAPDLAVGGASGCTRR